MKEDLNNYLSSEKTEYITNLNEKYLKLSENLKECQKQLEEKRNEMDKTFKEYEVIKGDIARELLKDEPNSEEVAKLEEEKQRIRGNKTRLKNGLKKLKVQVKELNEEIENLMQQLLQENPEFIKSAQKLYNQKKLNSAKTKLEKANTSKEKTEKELNLVNEIKAQIEEVAKTKPEVKEKFVEVLKAKNDINLFEGNDNIAKEKLEKAYMEKLFDFQNDYLSIPGNKIDLMLENVSMDEKNNISFDKIGEGLEEKVNQYNEEIKEQEDILAAIGMPKHEIKLEQSYKDIKPEKANINIIEDEEQIKALKKYDYKKPGFFSRMFSKIKGLFSHKDKEENMENTQEIPIIKEENEEEIPDIVTAKTLAKEHEEYWKYLQKPVLADMLQRVNAESEKDYQEKLSKVKNKDNLKVEDELEKDEKENPEERE